MSIVWNFFKEKEEERRLAVCSLCNAEFAKGPVNSLPKTWNTSNLQDHLKRNHREAYEAYEPEHKRKKLEREVDRPTPGSQKNRMQQASIDEMFPGGKKKWKNDDPRATRINQKLIQLIAMDNQPFSIVEDDGFIEYSAALNPLYSLPSRTKATEMLEPEYDRVQGTIQKEVDTADFINFTSDLWTEDTTRMAFISLTGDGNN